MAETPVTEQAVVQERSIEDRIGDLVDGGVLNLPDDVAKKQAAEAAAENPEPTTTTETEAPKAYEFEWKGAKYEVPTELKELHEGYLRTEDYTKKTQEAAELRKTAELTLQQAKNYQALQSALEPQLQELAYVNKQLKAYEGVDWNKLINDDPFEAQKHTLMYQQVKDQKSKAEDAIRQAAEKHGKVINEQRVKMIEETAKILNGKIKGWSSEKASALSSFAKTTYGFTEPELNEIIDPRRIEEMHDAYQWRQLQASKLIDKKVVPQSKTLKPQGTEGTGSKVNESELREKIASARSDQTKAKYIEQLLQSRIR